MFQILPAKRTLLIPLLYGTTYEAFFLPKSYRRGLLSVHHVKVSMVRRMAKTLYFQKLPLLSITGLPGLLQELHAHEARLATLPHQQPQPHSYVADHEDTRQ